MEETRGRMMLGVMTVVVATVAFVCAVAITVVSACDASIGKQVYEKNCVACHGKEGKGIMPKMPDFSKGERMDKSDKHLLSSISSGVKGTAMPAWKGKLNDADMSNVLCYVKTIGPKKTAVTEIRREEPKKDAVSEVKKDANKEETSKSDPCGDKEVKKTSKKKAAK